MSKRSGAAPSRDGHLRSVLEGDHLRIGELLIELSSAIERQDLEQARDDHFVAVRCLLLSHARAEEEAVYAYIYHHTALRGLIEDCLDEHSEIEVLVEDLYRGAGDEDGWEDLVWALAATVELHLEQERREVYRLFEAELEDEIDADIAARYLLARDRWQRHLGCEPQDPASPVPMPR